jgi:heat-inducible transcriptional repressor
VTKRVTTYDEPVDGGIVKWAAAYLNEALIGMGLGARMLHKKLTDPGLSAVERGFLATLAPTFTELEETAEQTLYFDGTARLLSEERLQDLSQINSLLTALERRVALLAALRHALDEPGVRLSIGAENELPELRSLSVVAASYGLPGRALGAVSVLGPVRMDYGNAIVAVREAAAELSRFVGVLYDE